MYGVRGRKGADDSGHQSRRSVTYLSKWFQKIEMEMGKWIIFFFATFLVTGCGQQASDPMKKIKFDLDRLNDQGLQGPPDGLRSLSYEFCIPNDEALIQEVMQIDQSAQVYRGAPGRVGCGDGQLLVIGDTHQPAFRQTLEQLARLDYVVEVREVYFE